MKKSIPILIAVNVAIIAAIQFFHEPEADNRLLDELKIEMARKHVPSVDHSKFEVLQQNFETPQQVTAACISCHTERHKEVMASFHWNWEQETYVEGKGVMYLGKSNLLNNFCIGVGGNEKACAKCHIGFGMGEEGFNEDHANNVDCMVCHDQSAEYIKGAAMSGYPDRSVNLNKVAQSVGQPQNGNCGACHFFSGGGNNVKHGDLEVALLDADRQVDVHMGHDGGNMQCVACHEAENHEMKGRLYSVSSDDLNRGSCEDCHTPTPHLNEQLDQHTAKVACQTCHIPEYAKVNATKMAWDWSTAGKLKDGKPYHEEDADGNHTYLSIKGDFKWAKNVRPDYRWFNGFADHYLLGEKIDTTQLPVQINPLFGSHSDPKAKIYPVKIHRAKQIYDVQQQMLIQPRLYAVSAGDSAFWMDFNWSTAAAAGMEDVGLEFSGEYGFVPTEMYWPLNHMVAPAAASLSCAECHTRGEEGRLAGLNDFYMPGRDRSEWLDRLGTMMLLLALLGVGSHGAARIWLHFRNTRLTTG